MKQLSQVFTDAQLGVIIAHKRSGAEYKYIQGKLATQYGLDVSTEQIRRAFNKYESLFEVGKKAVDIKLLKDIARTKRANSLTAKENRVVLEVLNDRDDLMSELKALVEGMPAGPVQRAKVPAAKGKPAMTIEAMLSDIHIGKKTGSFDLEICRKRIKLFTTVLLQEIDRKAAHYSVERIILAILGDLIENALMHGRESQMGCEFGNAEQVRQAIDILFTEVIVPVAATKLPVSLVCIAGNHCREEERPTFQDPGKQSLSWIIYQTLKLLSDQAGYKNLTWDIPEGVYSVLDIYGTKILYEHGDRIKGDNSRNAFLAHLARRSGQVGSVLKGLRIGHWHQSNVYDNGAIIVNGSVCGQDSYAQVNGYTSVPSQTITYYVKTTNRDNAYYYSFPVQLGGAK